MSKKIERNDPCWCGSGKKYKKCHEAFDEKMELMKKKGYAVLDHDLIKTPAQIEKIKERGHPGSRGPGRRLWLRRQ